LFSTLIGSCEIDKEDGHSQLTPIHSSSSLAKRKQVLWGGEIRRTSVSGLSFHPSKSVGVFYSAVVGDRVRDIFVGVPMMRSLSVRTYCVYSTELLYVRLPREKGVFGQQEVCAEEYENGGPLIERQ
jgi:hypothetical protein